MVDVAAIFKAYDVRGVVPEQLDESVARATAFAEGVTSTGADVIDIGLASTDQLYFASGRLGLPGAMFTASHNPAQYNGIKLCRAGAVPIGQDSGLVDIRTTAQDYLEAGRPATVAQPGSRS